MAELKNLKKGDLVILRAFTGMAIGKKEVVAADTKTITIETQSGEQKKFSKKTGTQIEPVPKAERFANYIVVDDGSYEVEQKARAEKRVAAKAKAEKKSKKPIPPAELEDEDEDEDEVEDEEEKPAPKKATAKKSKKPEPAPEPEDDEDEDIDDDDYEEVE